MFTVNDVILLNTILYFYKSVCLKFLFIVVMNENIYYNFQLSTFKLIYKIYKLTTYIIGIKLFIKYLE